MCAAAILSVVPGLGVHAVRRISLLPDVPDGQCRDGGPERVIRGEDAVGDGCVELGVAVEPGAEAVEKGDGAEPWAG